MQGQEIHAVCLSTNEKVSYSDVTSYQYCLSQDNLMRIIAFTKCHGHGLWRVKVQSVISSHVARNIQGISSNNWQDHMNLEFLIKNFFHYVSMLSCWLCFNGQ